MSRFRNEKFRARTAAVVCLVFLMTVLPAVSSPGGTGERTLTNYQVLTKIADEAIDELMGNMPPKVKDAVIFLRKEGGVDTDIDKVFENELIVGMTDAGMRIATKTGDSNPAEKSDYMFSYQIVKYYIEYPEIGRSYWIGAKEVERLAEVGVFAKLLDSKTGEIVWVGETQKKYKDRIAYSLLERVEDPAREFTMPARHEIRWGRFVEPVIVTGIVVGLVYLFFSNQESN